MKYWRAYLLDKVIVHMVSGNVYIGILKAFSKDYILIYREPYDKTNAVNLMVDKIESFAAYNDDKELTEDY